MGQSEKSRYRDGTAGLALTPDIFGEVVHRDLIMTLAARHKLPAIYLGRHFVAAGGLIPMGLIFSTSTVLPPATWTASSRAKNPPIFQCRRGPNSNS